MSEKLVPITIFKEETLAYDDFKKKVDSRLADLFNAGNIQKYNIEFIEHLTKNFGELQDRLVKFLNSYAVNGELKLSRNELGVLTQVFCGMAAFQFDQHAKYLRSGEAAKWMIEGILKNNITELNEL